MDVARAGLTLVAGGMTDPLMNPEQIENDGVAAVRDIVPLSPLGAWNTKETLMKGCSAVRK